jgi:hypothetical protein
VGDFGGFMKTMKIEASGRQTGSRLVKHESRHMLSAHIVIIADLNFWTGVGGLLLGVSYV